MVEDDDYGIRLAWFRRNSPFWCWCCVVPVSWSSWSWRSAGKSRGASACRSAAAPRRTCAASGPSCCGWRSRALASPSSPVNIQSACHVNNLKVLASFVIIPCWARPARLRLIIFHSLGLWIRGIEPWLWVALECAKVTAMSSLTWFIMVHHDYSWFVNIAEVRSN